MGEDDIKHHLGQLLIGTVSAHGTTFAGRGCRGTQLGGGVIWTTVLWPRV